jgi:hypothetical protein
VGVSATEVATVLASPDPADRAPSVRRHRRRVVTVATIVTATVLLLVVPLLLPSIGFGIVSHEGCGLGQVEATGYFWTPGILLNSPYRGAAWANWTFQGVTYGAQVNDGNSSGLFELVEWNLSTTRNVSTMGPGVNRPCVRPFVPLSSPIDDQSPYDLAHPLNWSDANEIDNFSFAAAELGPGARQPVPSVRFDNAFDPAAVRSSFSSCLGGASGSHASSTEYDFEVPFTWNGHTLWVPAQFPAIVQYAYWFPANGGTWRISNPDPGGTDVSEGGWAFDYQGCGVP